MSIAFGMILVGAVLVYGGFTNRSVSALIRGDNTVAKAPEIAATAKGNSTRIQGPAGG